MPVVTLVTELDATQAFVMQYLVIYDWHSAALEKYKRCLFPADFQWHLMQFLKPFSLSMREDIDVSYSI